MTKKREPKTIFEHLGVNVKKIGGDKDNSGSMETLKKNVMSLVIFSALGFILGLIIELYVDFPVSLAMLLGFIWIWLYKKYGHTIFEK